MANEDIWSPLGEQKWRELADGTGASELQLKFAAARFGGASASRAAKLAGYSGDSDSLRRAGYSAVRSTAVQTLLELAAINAPGDAKISDKEIDAKLARLIRSGDPNVVIKAAELHAKREATKAAAGEHPDDDGLSEWRLERDFLMQNNGAVAYVLMRGIYNSHLLHDTHALMMQQRFGPELWEACRGQLSDSAREDLDRRLGDKKYQLEVRRRVWAEVGIRLDDNGQFNLVASYAP
jgi:hypothetical protein